MNYEETMRAGGDPGDPAVRQAPLADLVSSVTGMFKRRWLTFALVTGAMLALGLVLVLLIAPKYESIARIRIDPTRNPLATSQGEAMASLNSESIETEVSVLQSPDLARAVVRRLNLVRDPEFSRGLGDNGPITAEERETAVASRVMRDVTVGRDKLTYIIAVRAASHDPIKAARLANGFADSYLDLRVGNRLGTAERQARWFTQRLRALGDEVRAADGRVAQYRAAAGIVEGGANGTITDQQVAPIASQLATAESEAAEARSNLSVAQSQIARGGLDAVSEVRNSPVVADLRRQRAEVLRTQGEIEARYGEKHPESIKVRDQLAALEQQIQAEARRAVGSLGATASASQARASSLRGSLAQLRGRQASETRSSVTAQSLERDAAAKRAAYDRMSQLSLQSTQAAQNSMSQAEIVDRATPSAAPTAPNKKMLAVLAAIVALAAGLAVIIVLEMLAGGLRSIADIESRFGIPVLAAVPSIVDRKLLRSVGTPADLVIRQPASAYAESFRNVRASLFGVRGGNGVQVVALTSALPNEGKTTAALSLARVLAMSGTPTLLIDCDLRRASLRGLVDQPVTVGLVDVLNGAARPEQAVVHDQVERLDTILVTEPFFEPQEMFGAPMTTLLDWAKRQYGAVVLDLPPILGVADARSVAAAADRVALIVKWGSTPRKAVETALSMLEADGAPLAGAMYTIVSPKAEGVGGLSYAGRYAAYYQNA